MMRYIRTKTKAELKEDILREIKEITEYLRDITPTEKGLNKCNKNELLICLNAWRNTKIIGFELANDFDNVENCKDCKEILQKAKDNNKRVIVGLHGLERHHIIGVGN